MTTKTDAGAAGHRAAQILDLVGASEEYDRLVESTRMYPDCWAAFTGYPIIAQWDLATDGNRCSKKPFACVV